MGALYRRYGTIDTLHFLMTRRKLPPEGFYRRSTQNVRIVTRKSPRNTGLLDPYSARDCVGDPGNRMFGPMEPSVMDVDNARLPAFSQPKLGDVEAPKANNNGILNEERWKIKIYFLSNCTVPEA